MQNLLNFWLSIFWISIILFISNIKNVIKLIFYSEIVWVIFYCFLIILGSLNDDLNLISSSFFILGFAGLEYSIGLLLILIFNNINKNIILESKNTKNNYNFYLK